MENQVTDIIRHMADSHSQLAQLIAAKRQIIEHATFLLSVVPAAPGEGLQDKVASSLAVVTSVTSYLSSLAELENALADNLSIVIKELSEHEE